MKENIKQTNSGQLFIIFSIWSFILLCRPQDYLSFLGILRPNLTLGLLTLLIYFLSATTCENISNSSQFRLYRYLILVMFIGVPFSIYISASLKDVFNYACITTIFFYLFYQIVNTITKLRSILFLYCLGVSVYALYILQSGDVTEGRIFFGSMFDPNDIAFLIICFLPFNFLFITNENKGYIRIIAAVNTILGLIVMLKTGSRGGLMALICVFTYLMSVETNTLKLTIIKKAVLVVIIIITLPFANISSERYKTLLDMKEDYNVTGEEGRIAIWKTGMRIMISRPLTGVGMNRFSEGVGRSREERGLDSAKWQSPHNSIVQIGAEVGLFGLILFCLMSLNVFKITGQIINKSQSEELVKTSEMARAGFIGFIISAMFLSQAYSVYWIFYILLSATLGNISDNELTPTTTDSRVI